MYIYNNKIFPKNSKKLNKSFENKFKIDTIKSLANYFEKLK